MASTLHGGWHTRILAILNRYPQLRRVSQYFKIRRIWLKRRVQKAKAARAALPFSYRDHPNTSFILLSFNHRRNIKPIMKNLRLTTAQEYIICEDGSVDGSFKQWKRYLNRPNDFILCSNDLHETRAYDRGLRMARGEFVCLLQDDDIPPDQNHWYEKALGLFQIFPNMVILGGLWAYDFACPQLGLPFRRMQLREHRDLVGNVDYARIAVNGFQVPFRFVTSITVGPVFIRRQAFMDIGGFSTDYNQAGESGINIVDMEVCLRTWRSGGTVGYYEAEGFTRAVGGAGTALFDSGLTQVQTRTRRLLQDHYPEISNGQFRERVDQANAKLGL